MENKQEKPGIFRSFARSQVSALISTAVDFLVFIFLKDLLGIWYVYATALGAFAGAVVNFLLGRYWVFESTEGDMTRQAIRYTFISLGSLLLNTFGVYALTESLQLDPLYSKIIIGILVGVFYNFYFQKIFVYKT